MRFEITVSLCFTYNNYVFRQLLVLIRLEICVFVSATPKYADYQIVHVLAPTIQYKLIYHKTSACVSVLYLSKGSMYGWQMYGIKHFWNFF